MTEPGETAVGTAEPGTALRFGANYTPAKHWWHSWLDFAVDDVRRDFDAIAALGLDHVRIFPIWSYFQPNRGQVRSQALADLRAMVDLAAAAGLGVCVDALQGHLSSFEFYPPWTRTVHHRNIFTDPGAIEGEVRYLQAIIGAVGDAPNVFALTLGNEMNNLVPDNPCTPAEVDAWLDELLAVLDAGLPAPTLRLHSAYDAAWYTDGHPFTPQASARKGSLTTVHPWVFSGDCARRYGAMSTATTHLAEYGVELAKAYATEPRRIVWVQEFGAAEGHIPIADGPEFAAAAIANAVTCEDLYGVTWWCSHDVDRALIDYPALEYTLGLIDTDNVAKPIGRSVADAVAAVRAAPPNPLHRSTALVFAGGGVDSRAESGPGGAFFEAWMRLIDSGAQPAVVLADRADDRDYLAARGITELVRVSDT